MGRRLHLSQDGQGPLGLLLARGWVPRLPRAPAASGGCGRLSGRAVRASASLLKRGLRMCANSTHSLFYLTISGQLRPSWPGGRGGGGGAEKKSTGAATKITSLRSYPDLTCAQPMDRTTWPASLGSKLAGPLAQPVQHRRAA